MGDLEEVVLTFDEIEALRLADLEGLYQEQVATAMNVSRPTVGRILSQAHRKVAEALITGKAIRFAGGSVEIQAAIELCCGDCGHTWDLPQGSPVSGSCPACRSETVHRRADCQHPDCGCRRRG